MVCVTATVPGPQVNLNIAEIITSTNVATVVVDVTTDSESTITFDVRCDATSPDVANQSQTQTVTMDNTGGQRLTYDFDFNLAPGASDVTVTFDVYVPGLSSSLVSDTAVIPAPGEIGAHVTINNTTTSVQRAEMLYSVVNESTDNVVTVEVTITPGPRTRNYVLLPAESRNDSVTFNFDNQEDTQEQLCADVTNIET